MPEQFYKDRRPSRHAAICSLIFLAILSLFAYRMFQGSDRYFLDQQVNKTVVGGDTAVSVDTIALVPGSYHGSITYTAAQESTLNWYSPKTASADNQASRSFAVLTLPAGTNTIEFDLGVDQWVSDLSAYIKTGGSFTMQRLQLSSDQNVFRDRQIVPALYVLTAIIGLYLINRKQGQSRLEQPDAFRAFAALALLFLVSSAPVLINSLNNAPAQDLSYHLMRIEGLARAIRTQTFPYRIHGAEFSGYGQAEGVFYPELFTLLPGVLRAAGMSVFNAYRVYELALNGLTIAISYFSFRALFSSRRAGLLGSAIYTLSVYRLTAMYVRMAMGAYTAMAFLPLAVLGFHEVFSRDWRRWGLLAAAMTCILQSHLITFEMTLGLCLLFGLLSIRSLIRDHQRLMALLKAVLLSLLLNLWWIVPFLDFAGFGVGALSNQISLQKPYIYDVTKLFAVTYPLLDGDQMPFSVGALLFATPLVTLIMCLFPRLRRDPRMRPALMLAGVSLLLCWMATVYFPWNSSALLIKLGSTIQFAFRTLEMATILDTVLALLLISMAEEAMPERKLRAVQAAAAACTVLLSLPILIGYRSIPVSAVKSTLADPDSDKYLLGGWYLPENTEIYELYYRPKTVQADHDAVITNLSHRGTTLEFDFSAAEGASYELPVIYYPGYSAEVNGKAVAIERDSSNLILVHTDELQGHIRLTYQGKMSYNISGLISLTAVGMSFILWIRAGKHEDA